MCQKTERVAATTAYLVGVECNWSYRGLDREELESELDTRYDAKVLRTLCRLRTILMKNLTEIENYRSYTLGSCEGWTPWFDKSDFEYLSQMGCKLNTTPKKMDALLSEINDKIVEMAPATIDGLYPSWVRRDLLVKLFFFPKRAGRYTIKEEQKRYKKNYDRYPFQAYIYLQEPEACSTYLFRDDDWFLTELHLQSGEAFADHDRCQDASVSVKRDVFNFLSDATKTVLVVDCENSEPYKLFSFLTAEGIKQHADKISKIVLYDDVNTTNLWGHLQDAVSIPVERIETRRILPRKSVVDAVLTADICRLFYRDEVDSFILCSSDSDYIPVITALPEASFFVLTEVEKVSDRTIQEFDADQIAYASLDDFKAGDYEAFTEAVLVAELTKRLPDVIGRNAKGLTDEIFLATGIEAGEAEREAFYKKYVKRISLKLNDTGVFEVFVA